MMAMISRHATAARRSSQGAATGAVAAALADAATADADAAALSAAVAVREVGAVAELDLIRDLFDQVWEQDPADSSMPGPVLRALATAGNYVAGAWRGRELVGACVGFFGRAGTEWELHSHIAGVIARARGSNVGFALKTHQRAWALRHGVEHVTWTFDPLVARNVYFNATKLAAGVRAYLPEFYGPMPDGLNHGDLSDRLLADWSLTDDRVAAACARRCAQPDLTTWRAAGAQPVLRPDESGWPARSESAARTVLITIPSDIEALRRAEPVCARAWRLALREELGGRYCCFAVAGCV
jgi:predicted GNAT superfamily acetyltransferase